MQTHEFESPAKLSICRKTWKELELQVSIASVFTYNELYSGRLVARTPAFQVGEAGSKPVRSTKFMPL
jgi:hypothetical protein